MKPNALDSITSEQRSDWPYFLRRVALSVTAILAASSALPGATSAQQDVLTATIDRTGSPRDDFFQYANGEWLKRHPIPDDQARWGVGLRVALDAFKNTPQFRKNERLGGFTPLQRFLLAYAYSWMGHERNESLASRLKGGPYAPNRERVNGVVMNLPEFYEAFDVRPGDRMYRPESARVTIW